MMKTVFINGSPKKKFSASGYFLSMQRIFVGGQTVTENLRGRNDHKRILNQIANADAVVFSVPLYVDGIPSHVLAFLQEMEHFCRENLSNIKIYVVSNNGFIEGKQNAPLFRVFENFCVRSGVQWCGGIGIGGGVMFRALTIVFFLEIGILLFSVLASGTQYGNWLPADAIFSFVTALLIIAFFNLGALFYTLKMGVKINRGKKFGEKYTRILLPSFIFILIADIFFFVISMIRGGIFRGWLMKKQDDKKR